MTRRDNLIGLGCVVENDLFDIAARLREIDSDYFVFYSYKRRRYEVHCLSLIHISEPTRPY